MPLPQHDGQGLEPIFDHVLSPRIPQRPRDFRPFPSIIEHKGCNFPIFSTQPLPTLQIIYILFFIGIEVVEPSLPALLARTEVAALRNIEESPGNFVPFIVEWVLSSQLMLLPDNRLQYVGLFIFPGPLGHLPLFYQLDRLVLQDPRLFAKNSRELFPFTLALKQMSLYEILDKQALMAAEGKQKPLVRFQLVLQPHNRLNPFLVVQLTNIEAWIHNAQLFQEFLEFFYCESVHKRSADFVPPADSFQVAFPAFFKHEVMQCQLHSIFQIYITIAGCWPFQRFKTCKLVRNAQKFKQSRFWSILINYWLFISSRKFIENALGLLRKREGRNRGYIQRDFLLNEGKGCCQLNEDEAFSSQSQVNEEGQSQSGVQGGKTAEKRKKEKENTKAGFPQCNLEQLWGKMIMRRLNNGLK